MNALFRGLADVFERGGVLSTAAIVFVCIVFWMLVLERVGAWGLSLRDCLLPERRKRRAAGRAAFLEAFRAYVNDPDPGQRQALLATAEAWPSPLSLFARRAVGLAANLTPGARKTVFDAAMRLGCREVERGLQAIWWYTHASLLLGVAAVVSAFTNGFMQLAAAGLTLESTWRDGAGNLLMTVQLAVLVLLPSWVAGLCVSGQTRAILKELKAWYHLLVTVDGKPRLEVTA